MTNLKSVLFVSFLATTGCTTTCECKWDDSFCPQEEQDTDVEDTDTLDTDTDDTDTDVQEDAVLTVGFTTAVGHATPYGVDPGDKQVEMGGWGFTSSTDEVIDVSTVTYKAYVDSDDDDQFADHDVEVADHLKDCVLKEFATGAVYAGPVNPEGDYITFIDDFVVQGVVLNIYCDVTETSPESPIGIAWDIDSVEADAVVDIVQTNRGWSPTVNVVIEPRVRKCFYETTVVREDGLWEVGVIGNELWTSLSTSTPSGTGFVPGDMELMRFNVQAAHEDCDDMEINQFTIACLYTKNDPEWVPMDMRVYDLSVDPTTPLKSTGTYYYGNMYAMVDVEGVIELPAGSSHTLSVWADVTGASTTADDAVSCSLWPYDLVVSDNVGTYEIYGPMIRGWTINF